MGSVYHTGAYAATAALIPWKSPAYKTNKKTENNLKKFFEYKHFQNVALCGILQVDFGR